MPMNAEQRLAYYRRVGALLKSYGLKPNAPTYAKEPPMADAWGTFQPILRSFFDDKGRYTPLIKVPKDFDARAHVTFDSLFLPQLFGPKDRWMPTAVATHEYGHASGWNAQRHPDREEARATAIEQVLTPLIMRQIRSRVGAAFWEEMRNHPYRQDKSIGRFVEPEIKKLRAKLGASLYPGRS